MKCTTPRPRMMVLSTLIFLALASFTTLLAHAQAGRPSMKVDVPYAFKVGSKVLPPGSYTFSVADNANVLLVTPTSGSPISTLVVARITQPSDFLRAGAVVFDNNDGHRTLSELWFRGTDGLLLHSLAADHLHDVVLADFLDPNAAASGRDAFALTCARCHGADGRGNPSADSFFKITIPRLSSPLVQGMTDTQLRAQIEFGNKAMPPVEVDEGGFRHRLPAQDVDAVIAYVRTLK